MVEPPEDTLDAFVQSVGSREGQRSSPLREALNKQIHDLGSDSGGTPPPNPGLGTSSKNNSSIHSAAPGRNLDSNRYRPLPQFPQQQPQQQQPVQQHAQPHPPSTSSNSNSNSNSNNNNPQQQQQQQQQQQLVGGNKKQNAASGIKAADNNAIKKLKTQMESGQSNMLVCVRVRPLMSHDRTQKEVTRVLDGRVVIILDPNKVNEKDDILRAHRSREKRYAFDRVFEPTEKNLDVYQNTTRYLLAGVLEGYNATVFAYGNTGAGKTHTMIGSIEEPGIMVLTLRDLFKLSDDHGSKHGTKFRVTVSFIEVYNENIRDLLSTVDEFLDLREDPIKGPVISGVMEVETQVRRTCAERSEAHFNEARAKRASQIN